MKLLFLSSALLIFSAWTGEERLPVPSADAPSPLAVRMQQFVDEQHVSGAVTVVAQQGKIVGLNAVGLADIDAGHQMKPDTTFWIASMTKPIAVTAVMILQDEGKLSVNDPVGKYLPEFNHVSVTGGGSPARAVTIADLLSHISGVATPVPEKLSANPTLTEMVTAIAREPLQFEPGTKWKYGAGIIVAGRIVEVVTGKPFDAFLEERVCRPLKMNDTTFYPTAEQRGRLAVVYRRDKESKKLVRSQTPTPFNNADAAAPRRAPNPSGGLCSTAPDYYRFLQMILNGGELDGARILSAAAVKQMTALHTGELPAGHSPGQGWGLGWCIVKEPAGVTDKLSPGSFGHGGALGTWAWIDPVRQAVTIMMIARGDMGPAEESAVRGEFQRAAAQMLK